MTTKIQLLMREMMMKKTPRKKEREEDQQDLAGQGEDHQIEDER